MISPRWLCPRCGREAINPRGRTSRTCNCGADTDRADPPMQTLRLPFTSTQGRRMCEDCRYQQGLLFGGMVRP